MAKLQQRSRHWHFIPSSSLRAIVRVGAPIILCFLAAGCAAQTAAGRARAATAAHDDLAALAGWREAVAARPDNPIYRRELESTELRLARVEEQRGDEALAAGQLDEAILHYEAAGAERPEAATAKLATARAAREKRDAAKAHANAAQAQLDSDAAVARGEAALRQHRPRAALDSFEGALRLVPTHPTALLRRGEARHALALELQETALVESSHGRRGRAFQLYEDAMALAALEPTLLRELRGSREALGDELVALLLRRSDAAQQAGLAGAAWAWLLAARLVPGGAAVLARKRPEPDLDPSSDYAVAVSTGKGSLGELAATELLAMLSAAKLGGGVTFIADTDAAKSAARLTLSLDPIRVEHPRPELEELTAKYVPPVDDNKARRWQELWARVDDLEEQRQEFIDERLASKKLPPASAQALARARGQASNAKTRVHALAATEAGGLERAAVKLEAQAAVDAGRRRELQSQIAAEHSRAPTPSTTRERARLADEHVVHLESESAQVDRRETDTLRKAGSLRARAANLRRSPADSPELVRARIELDRADADARRAEARAGSPLLTRAVELDEQLRAARADLAAAPNPLPTPTVAVYRYHAEHHRLIAHISGTLSLVDSPRSASPAGSVENAPPRTTTLPLSVDHEAGDRAITAIRVPGLPDLVIPEEPLDLPPQSEVEHAAAVELGRLAARLLQPILQHHADRFVTTADHATGDEQLNAWSLAFYARDFLTRPLDARRAIDAIREAVGVDAETSELVDFTKLDGLR